ncbi:MAG: ribonuclease domain-containing protein [Bacteroidota bacterium]
MQKNYSQLIIGLIIGLLIGLFAGWQMIGKAVPVQNTNVVPVIPGEKKPAENTVPVVNDNSQRTKGIPQKVYDDLKYIRENNHAMPGYVGGRIFSNREELLPWEDNNGKPILYHEWDVNPKIEGQNRGTERIITGSDGRAWYTNDHYQSFKEIK